MKTIESSYSAAELDRLQARFALRVTAGLHELAQRTPPGVDERLRFAREQAIAKARESRRASTAPAVVATAGAGSAAALLGGGMKWWMRMAAVVPLAVLVGGLVLIQNVHQRAQIEAAADIDAALLTDNLPPDAYADPGFLAFVQAPPQ